MFITNTTLIFYQIHEQIARKISKKTKKIVAPGGCYNFFAFSKKPFAKYEKLGIILVI
jgi:hypothetical protein